MNILQRTGRTTEMLKMARDAALAGASVLVLVVRRGDTFIFRDLLNEIGGRADALDRNVTFWTYEDLARGELDGQTFDHVLQDHTVDEHRSFTWHATKARVMRALERPWPKAIAGEFVDEPKQGERDG